jgi:hypothetical protein
MFLFNTVILLRCTPGFYRLPNGFYGIESVFLLLGLKTLNLGFRRVPGQGQGTKLSRQPMYFAMTSSVTLPELQQK